VNPAGLSSVCTLHSGRRFSSSSSFSIFILTQSLVLLHSILPEKSPAQGKPLAEIALFCGGKAGGQSPFSFLLAA
jgi:hypothetical protein